MTCVPTNVLELIDVAAARDAVDAGEVESRRPVERPLDVLVQHMVTVEGLAAGVIHARSIDADQQDAGLDDGLGGGGTERGELRREAAVIVIVVGAQQQPLGRAQRLGAQRRRRHQRR